ncbi:hypothetical protein [Alteribacter natronophilus]|uniref:hypothetical protein n=1 Tax=Alteribacter natronophilus TaxID=2583810 RepID=UPI00110E637D|nr:hypothetical protein [Alteribacter natronophilus]TMW70693.1 hypothetical protein FGB90_16045 [Alteribacter natronophilus]
MKVMSKTLLAGAMSLSVALAACAADEEADTENGATDQEENGMDEDAGDEEDGEEDDLEDDADENGVDDDEAAEEDDDAVDNGAGAESGITIVEADDDQIAYDANGAEGSVDAEIHETSFGGEIKLMEGLELEEGENGTDMVIVEDEDHQLYGLRMIITQSLNAAQGEEHIVTEVNVEREIELREPLIENRSYVDSYDVHEMQEETEFDVYFRYEGEASGGGWTDALQGQALIGYEFYSFFEYGSHDVTIQFPEEAADEEYEAIAVAMANTFTAPDEDNYNFETADPEEEAEDAEGAEDEDDDGEDDE